MIQTISSLQTKFGESAELAPNGGALWRKFAFIEPVDYIIKDNTA